MKNLLILALVAISVVSCTMGSGQPGNRIPSVSDTHPTSQPISASKLVKAKVACRNATPGKYRYDDLRILYVDRLFAVGDKVRDNDGIEWEILKLEL